MAKANTAKKPPTPQIGAEVTYIPYSQLSHSLLNMRHDQGDVTDLAANIAGTGRLLHNLVVCPTADNDAGLFEVVDGGRRLKALAMLVDQGAIELNSSWPCQIVTRDEANALSLSANKQREDVHPVDEAIAFNRLIVIEKMKVPAIALLYGVSKRYVEQRRKLAHVHHEILAACRAGKITLETLQAFTVVDDRFRQFDVFVDLDGQIMGPEDEMDPDDVRDALLQEAIEDDHRLVKFVGLDAYREAGGTFLTDLFSDEDQPTLLGDVALVRKLAEKKLKSAAKKVTGWAWVATTTDSAVNQGEFERVSPVGDEFTAEELTYVGAVVMVGYDGEEKTLNGFIRCKDSDHFERLQGEIVESSAPTPVADIKDDDREEADDRDFPYHSMPTAETDKVRAARLNAKVASYRARMAVTNMKLKAALSALEAKKIPWGEDATIREALVAAIETLDEIANEE